MNIKKIYLIPALILAASMSFGGDILSYHGDPIPEEIETIYTKGLAYLAKTQTDAGCWQESYGSEPGVVGLAILSMLAHGDDPNYGPYSSTIKKGLNFILTSSRTENGYMGSSMYSHGFATLALAEAYGCVNDERLGPALKKAVELILTSQANNPKGAWRYSPEATDADTTVSGAQMVALFAARNAGIGVPDKSIKKALQFFQECQSGNGGFGYTGGGDSSSSGPRCAIGTLVLALAKQKSTTSFKSAFRSLQQISGSEDSYAHYFEYYAAQAYFHADMEPWKTWNDANIKKLKTAQNQDGSWPGNMSPTFATSSALLSLAVNYRFLPIYER